jgi:hypothetical protein
MSPKPLDDFGRGMLLVLWLFSGLLIVGGVLVGRGRKIGMWVAAPSLLLIMCGFPIGSILAFVVGKKVSAAADAGALT